VSSGQLAGLADPDAFARHLAPVRRAEWVVYAKPPFGGPEQVLAYLGRYTHRVALTNSRLLDLEDGRVLFRWKDYRHHDKVMSLEAGEFIRRFLLHVLPAGFHRIRHFGFLAIAPASWRCAAGCSQSRPQSRPNRGLGTPSPFVDKGRTVTPRYTVKSRQPISCVAPGTPPSLASSA
jgi:hypothetical protein